MKRTKLFFTKLVVTEWVKVVNSCGWNWNLIRYSILIRRSFHGFIANQLKLNKTSSLCAKLAHSQFESAGLISSWYICSWFWFSFVQKSYHRMVSKWQINNDTKLKTLFGPLEEGYILPRPISSRSLSQRSSWCRRRFHQSLLAQNKINKY